MKLYQMSNYYNNNNNNKNISRYFFHVIKSAKYGVLLVIYFLSLNISCIKSDRTNSDSNLESTYNNLPVFEIAIPRNDPTNACIKMQSSFYFAVTYQAKNKTGTYMNNVNFTLTEEDNMSYSGYCQPDRNVIEISFLDDWRIELYFYKKSTNFLFNHVVLYYKLTSPLFPYSTHQGAQSEVYDNVFINSTLSNSYRCLSGIELDLGEVVVYMKNLIVEPFFNKRPNLPFDPEILCTGDIEPKPYTDTNTWLFIIISVFVIFIVIICTLFTYLKWRCRSDDNDLKNFNKESGPLIVRV